MAIVECFEDMHCQVSALAGVIYQQAECLDVAASIDVKCPPRPCQKLPVVFPSNRACGRGTMEWFGDARSGCHGVASDNEYFRPRLPDAEAESLRPQEQVL